MDEFEKGPVFNDAGFFSPACRAFHSQDYHATAKDLMSKKIDLF